MIWTIVQTSWRRLRNNRSELILTFVVPIIFFSIFAVIFGSRDTASSTPKIRIAISEITNSDSAHPSVMKQVHLIAEDLRKQSALRLTQEVDANGELLPLSRQQVEELVQRGMISAGITFETSASGDQLAKVDVLTDSYDQVASQVVSSLVQRSVFSSIPSGPLAFPAANTPKVPQMPPALASEPVDSIALQPMRAEITTSGLSGGADASEIRSDMAKSTGPSSGLKASMPSIATVDVLGGRKTNPTIAMYAAGIAVMFLLFSATASSGSLLDEKDNSTLDRLLCSQLSMNQLLMGKWVFLTGIGCLQLFLMFLWGAVVFRIEVLRNWEGAVAMSLVTAGAASSFALLLATLCSSRNQLSWISTIVILSMSALGGSMIPRYLMSETIQNIGLITFNAWALDGFNKVFWRELPLDQIGLELGVLAGCAGVFIVLARLFAVRWERT